MARHTTSANAMMLKAQLAKQNLIDSSALADFLRAQGNKGATVQHGGKEHSVIDVAVAPEGVVLLTDEDDKPMKADSIAKELLGHEGLAVFLDIDGELVPAKTLTRDGVEASKVITSSQMISALDMNKIYAEIVRQSSGESWFDKSDESMSGSPTLWGSSKDDQIQGVYISYSGIDQEFQAGAIDEDFSPVDYENFPVTNLKKAFSYLERKFAASFDKKATSDFKKFMASQLFEASEDTHAAETGAGGSPYDKLCDKAKKEVDDTFALSAIRNALNEMEAGADEQESIDYEVAMLSDNGNKAAAKEVVKFFKDNLTLATEASENIEAEDFSTEAEHCEEDKTATEAGNGDENCDEVKQRKEVKTKSTEGVLHKALNSSFTENDPNFSGCTTLYGEPDDDQADEFVGVVFTYDGKDDSLQLEQIDMDYTPEVLFSGGFRDIGKYLRYAVKLGFKFSSRETKKFIDSVKRQHEARKRHLSPATQSRMGKFIQAGVITSKDNAKAFANLKVWAKVNKLDLEIFEMTDDMYSVTVSGLDKITAADVESKLEGSLAKYDRKAVIETEESNDDFVSFTVELSGSTASQSSEASETSEATEVEAGGPYTPDYFIKVSTGDVEKTLKALTKAEIPCGIVQGNVAVWDGDDGTSYNLSQAGIEFEIDNKPFRTKVRTSPDKVIALSEEQYESALQLLHNAGYIAGDFNGEIGLWFFDGDVDAVDKLLHTADFDGYQISE